MHFVTGGVQNVDQLASFPWQAIGLSGMAVLAVFLVLTGRIVPRSALDDAIQRGKEWKDAHAESEKQREAALDVARENAQALHKVADRVDLPTALLQALRGETSPPKEP